MKIQARELPHALKKRPYLIYWVSGDEKLLVQEAASTIRSFLNTSGEAELLKCHVDNSFEPDTLLSLCANGSLFASEQIIQVSVDEKSPASFTQTLTTLAEQLDENCRLVIEGPRLSAQQMSSKWAKTLDKNTLFVPVWPVNAHDMPNWLIQRAKAKKIDLHKSAAHFITECTEGNLLGAAQAVDKLFLEYGEGEVTLAQAEASLSDIAHFDVYAYIDALWLGDKQKAHKIFHSLRKQSVEPTIIVWTLAQEIRLLLKLLKEKNTTPLQQLFQQNRIFPKKQPAISAALQRFTPTDCYRMLQNLAKMDRGIKGVESILATKQPLYL